MFMSTANISEWSRQTSHVDVTSAMGVTPSKVLISDEGREIIQWIIYAFMVTIVSSCGTVSNTLNIICFARQGLKDPVNVSLMGLAISDLGCLITALEYGIGYPIFNKLDVPFDPVDVQYLVSGWPHVVFTGVSSWLTALITLERCLCITMPLKVKRIITPKRITIIIICVFTLFICSVSPIYYANRLSWMFSPQKNRSILRLTYTEDRGTVDQISTALNNVLLPFTAYVIIIICTITLVVKLRSKAKWRAQCIANVNVDSTSERDQKIAKMVVVVSTLFIACFSPLMLSFLAMFVVPELALDGPNQNTLYLLGGVGLFLESTNSSANIFIYYHMSSKYRDTFRKLFLRK